MSLFQRFQDIHIICDGDVHARAEGLEQVLRERVDEVVILDWGRTSKLEQGYIILEWDGKVDEEFLRRMEEEPWVLDYYVYSVPCTEFSFDSSVPVEQFILRN